jgi:competence protein ComEA
MPRRLNTAAVLKLLIVCVGIFVFLSLAPATHAAKKHPPSKPVDLNTATVQEFEQLPGIGATTAKAIVEFRAKSGRFRRVEDLLAVRGISENKLNKLRPYITVSAPAKKSP